MSEVSVVITAYNNSDSIRHSINSALSQSYSNIEIIIVDDASTDGTLEIIEEYESHRRVKIKKHSRNRGGSAARNTGIAVASGEYIALLDGDDYWKVNKIEDQVSLIESSPSEVVAVYCGFEVKPRGVVKTREAVADLLNTDGNQKEPNSVPEEGGEDLIPYVLSMELKTGGSSSFLFRRSVAEEIDGFDERFPRHQDWEFLIRLLDQGAIRKVDRPLFIKNEDGAHSPKQVSKAKELYFSKFHTKISRAKERGFDIETPHIRHLSYSYLQSGFLLQGLRYFVQIRPTTKADFRGLIWSAAVGISTIVKKYITR